MDKVEKISLYIDGMLSEADKRELEAHIATCEGCAACLKDFERIAREAEGMQVVPPPGTHDAILSAVRASGRRRQRLSIFSRRSSFGLVAAALVVLMLTSTFGDMNRFYLFGGLADNAAGGSSGAASPAASSVTAGTDQDSVVLYRQAGSDDDTTEGASADSLQQSGQSLLMTVAPPGVADDSSQKTNSQEPESGGEPSTEISGQELAMETPEESLFYGFEMPYEGRTFAFVILAHSEEGAETPAFFDDFKQEEPSSGGIRCIFLYHSEELVSAALAELGKAGFETELSSSGVWQDPEAVTGLLVILP